MLTIKCAKCKKKLFKYQKIGKGKVLKCHKSRMNKVYHIEKRDEKYRCPCNNLIGKDKGSYIKMVDQSFTYSGRKE
ncbi:hypothetical protein ISALK_04965 [Isachenkonia alkalipeptolytica]|uniref:Uncharacterized protein n=1 Tax=Isachenkonia alkalipeptolytica TaxID=2565777 RepID=A0AA43XL34_9CLOT|nr:hypothetical protein [Isachenkonia alkalipeptolytica]